MLLFLPQLRRARARRKERQQQEWNRRRVYQLAEGDGKGAELVQFAGGGRVEGAFFSLFVFLFACVVVFEQLSARQAMRTWARTTRPTR